MVRGCRGMRRSTQLHGVSTAAQGASRKERAALRLCCPGSTCLLPARCARAGCCLIQECCCLCPGLCVVLQQRPAGGHGGTQGSLVAGETLTCIHKAVATGTPSMVRQCACMCGMWHAAMLSGRAAGGTADSADHAACCKLHGIPEVSCWTVACPSARTCSRTPATGRMCSTSSKDAAAPNIHTARQRSFLIPLKRVHTSSMAPKPLLRPH
jgi:hypothetical protein